MGHAQVAYGCNRDASTDLDVDGIPDCVQCLVASDLASSTG